jgi:D-sedoheptulose 7-phosphate isomerase
MMRVNAIEQIREIIEAHKTAVTRFEMSGLVSVIKSAEAIVGALKKGATIFICGNGGSAADAQHIASELVNRFEGNRKAIAAVALTTDTSIITSIANDDSYERIFARQAEALVKKGDVFWALSTSGSSPNMLAVAKVAKSKGALVLAFTGKTKSKLRRLADICFCANDESTARSQEIHQLAYHIICKLVESRFGEAGKKY